MGFRSSPTSVRLVASLQSRRRWRSTVHVFGTLADKVRIAYDAHDVQEAGADRRPRLPELPLSNSLYLSPIELAVLAELNLELARDHEQVADDLNNQDETRRTARRIATERRARARTLQAEVNRLSGQPLTDDDQLISDSRPAYVGPERRKANRRVRERRRGPSRPLEAPGLIERRSSLDQRRGERRRPPVARS